ncbi:MAG: RIP metalloprotease RseP [Elusimicrobia bacterium]|nr:RIP metalloprotease RseP [Elusimicrobiota bacterium]
MNIIYIIIAFSFVIFFHEFGHFILAKILGIKVEKFSIGFGPALIKIKKKTQYVLAAIPLGGFVKMKGENPYDGEREFSDDEFFSKTPLQRSLVVIAGPLANFLLGFLIFFFVFWAGGVLSPVNKPIVGEVFKGTPAEKAGLKKGDVIISINGGEIRTWEELVKTVHPKWGKELVFEIRRDEKTFTKKITPRYDKTSKVGLIGIEASYEKKSVSVLVAFSLAAKKSVAITLLTVRYIYRTLVGKVRAQLSGPIGIASMMNKTLKQGWVVFFNLLALVSLNLGLINLFPIPLMDGGHVAIFAWESFRRKFPSRKAYNVFQTIGLAIILFIIVFATRSDLLRIFRK